MKISRKPEWLKIQLPKTNEYKALNDLIVKIIFTLYAKWQMPNMSEC